MSIKNSTRVAAIDYKTASKFLFKYHYLGKKKFRHKYIFGLFDIAELNNPLIAVIVFHDISAPETVVGAFGNDRKDQAGFLEIGRLAIHPDFNRSNVGSYFIWACIKIIKNVCNLRAIITYADSSFHYGAVYQASNFKYYGLTDKKKDFIINGKTQERGKTKGVDGSWIDRSQKHRYCLIFDESLNINWVELRYPKNDYFEYSGKNEDIFLQGLLV